MLQRTKFLAPTMIAASLMVASGCVAPRWDTPDAATPVAHRAGSAQLFQPAGQYGAVALRILDGRPRGTQALGDLDPTEFNAVRFTLTHPTYLKTPMFASFAKTAGNVYSTTFKVPADFSPNYRLQAGVHFLSSTGLASASEPTFAEYFQDARRVGEGVSIPFAIQPNSTVSVAVVINTVGQATVDSMTFYTASTSAIPELIAGDPTSYVAAGMVNRTKFPAGGTLRLSVWPYGASAPVASYSLDSSLWPLSGGATVGFTAPNFGNYDAQIELASGSQVISTLHRLFTVLNAVEISTVSLQ